MRNIKGSVLAVGFEASATVIFHQEWSLTLTHADQSMAWQWVRFRCIQQATSEWPDKHPKPDPVSRHLILNLHSLAVLQCK